MKDNTQDHLDKYGPFAPFDPAKHLVVHNFASATEACAAAAAESAPRHAEPHEMACCFGTDDAQAIRCIRPAKWIKRDEPFIGRAYCDEHPPLKRKGSYWVPVPVVRIER